METEKSNRGFTLIEILVILALFMLIAIATYPNILSILNRNRIEGTAQQAKMLMLLAQNQAVKRSCYGVVRIEPGTRKVVAFADLDRDGEFEPNAATPELLLGVVDLPPRVDFRDETGAEGLDSVRGLVNPDAPDTLPDGQVMFREDGSVLETGALRFADDRGNVLEVNVESRTSGKAELRMWNGTAYVAKDEGSTPWTFK